MQSEEAVPITILKTATAVLLTAAQVRQTAVFLSFCFCVYLHVFACFAGSIPDCVIGTFH
jgi:hypothetical protein